MKYDNERDQFKYGYDRGQILDGKITLDPERNEYVLVDGDGIAFSSQEFFKTLVGKDVRFTCASYETISTIESLLKATQVKVG
jgi:hypothetical protein